MMHWKHLAIGAAATLAMAIFAAPAHAATFTLGGDFSNTVNPNGPWSFTFNAIPLIHFGQPATGNSLEPAATNGYWGVGPDFNTFTPEVLKVTVNGANTAALAPPGGFTFGAPFTNDDFLAGDVLLHSANPSSNGVLAVNWTAPTAGVIDFTGSSWYAHSFVNRSNDLAIFLGATQLGSYTLTRTTNRSNAQSFGGSALVVAAGDILSFRYTPTGGQPFGSLAGLDATINFTANATGAVPEPATWAMMIFGFGMIGGAMRRRTARTTAHLA